MVPCIVPHTTRCTSYHTLYLVPHIIPHTTHCTSYHTLYLIPHIVHHTVHIVPHTTHCTSYQSLTPFLPLTYCSQPHRPYYIVFKLLIFQFNDSQIVLRCPERHYIVNYNYNSPPGKDCIGCAKTGSGKTAAFALPILDKLSDDPYGIFALVLTPTRELAFQIKDQFSAIGAHINVRVSVVIGGLDMMVQSQELARQPHVVVATPGRLADHISSGDGLKLDKIKFLVLDEADRLFEPCFEPDLATIFSSLPTKRQTLLFSATLTDSIEELKQMSPSPPHVYISPSEVATVETLTQQYMCVPEMMRNASLAHILQEHVADKTCIVFTHSCKSAQLLTIALKKLGLSVTALHSILSQNSRLSSLAKFKSGVVKLLVATDVGSRGLDIPLVSFVINYNTPSSPTDYIHRVGRTARAGQSNSQQVLKLTL